MKSERGPSLIWPILNLECGSEFTGRGHKSEGPDSALRLALHTLKAPTVTIDNIPTLANGTWPIQAMIGGVSSPAGTVLRVQQ